MLMLTRGMIASAMTAPTIRMMISALIPMLDRFTRPGSGQKRHYCTVGFQGLAGVPPDAARTKNRAGIDLRMGLTGKIRKSQRFFA